VTRNPEACPTDAITHGHGFEVASFDRSTLVKRKEDILEPVPEDAKPPVIAVEEPAAAH
jgi:NADH-quinone oxidoreductase subunit I